LPKTPAACEKSRRPGFYGLGGQKQQEKEKIMNPVDMLLDENNTDNIVLYNEENEAVEFEQIAVIPVGLQTYVILKPVTPIEDMGEDEALVFSVDEWEGESELTVVTDEEIVDLVFARYYEMLEEDEE
jgi:hypothetical protein